MLLLCLRQRAPCGRASAGESGDSQPSTQTHERPVRAADLARGGCLDLAAHSAACRGFRAAPALRRRFLLQASGPARRLRVRRPCPPHRLPRDLLGAGISLCHLGRWANYATRALRGPLPLWRPPSIDPARHPSRALWGLLLLWQPSSIDPVHLL